VVKSDVGKPVVLGLDVSKNGQEVEYGCGRFCVETTPLTYIYRSICFIDVRKAETAPILLCCFCDDVFTYVPLAWSAGTNYIVAIAIGV
jgi:hypothetical protein